MLGRQVFADAGDTRIIIGVMSGTSADGTDVAICRLPRASTRHPGDIAEPGQPWGELLAFDSIPYSPELQRDIHGLRKRQNCTLESLADLTRRLTLEHAAAIAIPIGRLRLATSDFVAIADHGQTVFHAPPLTLQLLDPALLAWESGLTVISDFRRADCAAGGQGAPLVPFADQILFSHPQTTRALLNLGGIANITLLPATHLATNHPPIAFDTGPANCLSDHLCRTQPAGTAGYDPGGHIAGQGTPRQAVITAFLKHPYFSAEPPKSTDGPAMIEAFEKAGGTNLPLADALATAAECVACTVVDALRRLRPIPEEVIASGGGLKNATLVRALTRRLGNVPLKSTDDFALPSPAKEAIAFALLGNACLDGVPGNLPSCTGASRPVILGSVTPSTL